MDESIFIPSTTDLLLVRIQSDSATAMAYVNHQDVMKNEAEALGPSHILRWVEQHILFLSAVYIHSIKNLQVAYLCHQALDPGEVVPGLPMWIFWHCPEPSGLTHLHVPSSQLLLPTMQY